MLRFFVGLVVVGALLTHAIANADTAPTVTLGSDEPPVHASCIYRPGGIITISLKNVSGQAITSVRVYANVSGAELGDFSYAGGITANGAVQYEGYISEEVTNRADLSCTAHYVEFQDGSSWSVSTTSQSAETGSAAPQPVLPVELDSCQGYTLNLYTAAVGIAFHATTETATAVSFIFGVQDPFGGVAVWYMGTTIGTFAPGVTIEPRKPALNPNVFQSRRVFPQNTAWSFPITQSSSPEEIRCGVFKVRLADGSVWTNPATSNINPIPADD